MNKKNQFNSVRQPNPEKGGGGKKKEVKCMKSTEELTSAINVKEAKQVLSDR